MLTISFLKKSVVTLGINRGASDLSPKVEPNFCAQVIRIAFISKTIRCIVPLAAFADITNRDPRSHYPSNHTGGAIPLPVNDSSCSPQLSRARLNGGEKGPCLTAPTATNAGLMGNSFSRMETNAILTPKYIIPYLVMETRPYVFVAFNGQGVT